MAIEEEVGYLSCGFGWVANNASGVGQHVGMSTGNDGKNWSLRLTTRAIVQQPVNDFINCSIATHDSDQVHSIIGSALGHGDGMASRFGLLDLQVKGAFKGCQDGLASRGTC